MTPWYLGYAHSSPYWNVQVIYYTGVILQICGAMEYFSFYTRTLTLKECCYTCPTSCSGGRDDRKQELSLEGTDSEYIGKVGVRGRMSGECGTAKGLPLPTAAPASSESRGAKTSTQVWKARKWTSLFTLELQSLNIL